MSQLAFTTPLTITSQFGFCGLPLRLDSYAGCAFRCTFCFARFRGGNSFGEIVRPARKTAIERVFRHAFEAGRSPTGLLSQFLKRRVPIHFGGMSDPFQPAELRHRVTESFLGVLAEHEYPTVLSTRGKLVASDNYVSLLKRTRNVVVQFSFCSTRNETASKFEPYSTPPSELLETMEKLTKAGINVTCRWQPYIPGVSESADEFAERVSSTGCRHVALEHLKIPVERNHPLWGGLTRAAGRDLHAYYKTLHAPRDGREYILPTKSKLGVILEAAQAVRSRGMTFGAADNEFQYMSDTGCCCSGVDQFPGFENWFKHQIGYGIRRCIGRAITLDSLSREWAPTGSIDRFLNSRSRVGKRNNVEGSVQEHVRLRWNNPRAPGCPMSFHGVVETPRTSSAGNKIYEWDEGACEYLPSARGAALGAKPKDSRNAESKPTGEQQT
jgi:DNA repair photolyase